MKLVAHSHVVHSTCCLLHSCRSACFHAHGGADENRSPSRPLTRRTNNSLQSSLTHHHLPPRQNLTTPHQTHDPHAYAQVLILKEACDVRLVPLSHDSARAPALAHGAQAMDSAVLCPQIPPGRKLTFTWKIDNFLAFKEILETRKIFSKFFTVGGCDLRIGVYESFDTLCIYLESEAQSAGDPQEGSFWVQYRIAAVSQKKPELTEWKESSICTRAWNNSVLQFIKVPDMLNRCVSSCLSTEPRVCCGERRARSCA